MIPGPYNDIHLEEWQLVSLRVSPIAIKCIAGAVWVTWPKGRETVLKDGQQIRINATGKVCVQALKCSKVNIR